MAVSPSGAGSQGGPGEGAATDGGCSVEDLPLTNQAETAEWKRAGFAVL